MRVAEPHHDRRTRRRRLVAAFQLFACLDNRECLRGGDAEGLEHLGRKNFANAALERKPPVGGAAERGRPRTLGTQIEQTPVAVPHLREQESAPVADFRIVDPELMAVISQRQRLRQSVGQRREAREMGDPLIVGQGAEPDGLRPAIVAKAKRCLWETGAFHRDGQPAGQPFDGALGAIGGRLRFGAHPA